MKPQRLRPGDTIAVAAPASAPADESRLHRGVAYLEGLGYRVEVGRSTFRHYGYLSGPDPERLAELNRFLQRPDVKAVFCVRGGYGTLRLLPYVDYEAIRRHPKLVVGYSDITALHLAIFRRTGLPGLSGPMVAVEWPEPDPASERLFWELAGGAAPVEIAGPQGEPLETLRPGSAEGVLLGGNLSLVVRLIGTPYLPSLEGAILFLEEVGEEPYRIDGLLAQLRLSGILERLGGLVLGGFTDWEPPPDRRTLPLDQVFEDYIHDLPCPVAKGLVYGHFPVKSTLPVGVRARLTADASRASLTVLEPVTV